MEKDFCGWCISWKYQSTWEQERLKKTKTENKLWEQKNIAVLVLTWALCASHSPAKGRVRATDIHVLPKVSICRPLGLPASLTSFQQSDRISARVRLASEFIHLSWKATTPTSISPLKMTFHTYKSRENLFAAALFPCLSSPLSCLSEGESSLTMFF